LARKRIEFEVEAEDQAKIDRWAREERLDRSSYIRHILLSRSEYPVLVFMDEREEYSDDKESRDLRLQFRVSASELADIKKEAARVGLNPSDYGRRCVLRSHGKFPAVVQVPEITGKTYTQLGRIGNLLNQAIKAMNQGKLDAFPVDLLRDTVMLIKSTREQLIGVDQHQTRDL